MVHPSVLLHPHVHGHVPLITVGVHVAQVGVGVVYELKGAEQTAGVPHHCVAPFVAAHESHPLDAGVVIV